MNYAIIDTTSNLVINVIVWDGKPPWQPPEGTTTAPLTDGAGIGWSYIDGAFVPSVDP